MLVAATLQDRSPTAANAWTWSIGTQLEAIRARYEDADLSVRVIGFAKASARHR